MTHQRLMPLLHLLVRLGWQRDPDLWTVRCRDGKGRRARMRVHLTTTGISIVAPSPGPAQLTTRQVGQLRVALRDAALSFGELAGPDERRNAPRPNVVSQSPRRLPGREYVELLPATARPTVAQIAHRITLSSTPESADNPDHADDGRSAPERLCGEGFRWSAIPWVCSSPLAKE